ncbi:MAG: ABC transporter substrate-binding protein [Pseudomonadales bacterium]|nr:ABC transporter substrate-binding protein [Pseudomonadales bacterium]
MLRLTTFTLLLLLLTNPLSAQEQQTRTDFTSWPQVLNEARSQTVYFNAWGGEQRNNDFLAWVAARVEALYSIDLQHVKLGDTAEAVSRVLAEKQAGNTDNGAIDLIWLNGENFASMKENGLLFGPWAEQLPNHALLDAENHPEVRYDFTVPVEGMESPWLRAHLVFYYDSELVSAPPLSIPALLDWTSRHPGEFTYPRPPNFLGTTFLKQAALELATTPAALYQPVTEADFEQVTAPLWEFLDRLHPHLLRSGRSFPASGAELRRYMSDGEIALAFSFNPAEAMLAIKNGELPPSVRSYVLSGGTLANVSFLAIPFNARSKAAAMAVANFLLSPEAQARAQDPDFLGSTAVIALSQLNPAQRQLFNFQRHPALPAAEELQRQLQEPHPSWMPALEQAWLQRYSGR